MRKSGVYSSFPTFPSLIPLISKSYTPHFQVLYPTFPSLIPHISKSYTPHFQILYPTFSSQNTK